MGLAGQEVSDMLVVGGAGAGGDVVRRRGWQAAEEGNKCSRERLGPVAGEPRIQAELPRLCPLR